MTNETNKQKMHPYAQVLRWVAEGKEIEAYRDFDSSWNPTSNYAVLSAATYGLNDNEYLQPQDFRLKPERHIHQDVIDAWKNGAEIQFNNPYYNTWLNCRKGIEPSWVHSFHYRVKPEPKPDVTEILSNTMHQGWTKVSVPVCFSENIKVTRCGETGKLKSVEII